MNRTIEVLERAKAAIVQYGWITGNNGYPQVGFCARGAVLYVTGTDQNDPAAEPALRTILRVPEVADFLSREWGCTNLCGVTHWNDYKAASKEDVLTMFDAAIVLAQQEHELTTL